MAQPSTEIYLFDLSFENWEMTLSNPVNISNNEGYDNQPSFWPDGKSILYARTIEGQTEIARYKIKSGKTKIITDTKQGSEYSPIPMPYGKKISSIRLDTTGFQALYAYDLKGRGELLGPPLVIGYHAWITELEFVTFVLGDTITMEIIHSLAGASKKIGENIGRSLHKVPNSNKFSFVDKTSEPWQIKTRDLTTGEIEAVVSVLEGSEDYCWTPSGEILMGQGDTIYFWLNGPQWKPVIVEGEVELKNVTRMAVSPDGTKLVVVISE